MAACAVPCLVGSVQQYHLLLAMLCGVAAVCCPVSLFGVAEAQIRPFQFHLKRGLVLLLAQVSADQWWDIDNSMDAAPAQQVVKTRAEWDS